MANQYTSKRETTANESGAALAIILKAIVALLIMTALIGAFVWVNIFIWGHVF